MEEFSSGDVEDVNLAAEAWKQVIAVQMHFNDVCLRIRSFGVAAMGVILAASGISNNQMTIYSLSGAKLSSVQVSLLAALVIWVACFFADRFWYHQLLLAAVKHGQKLEEKLSKRISGVSLTSSIADSFPRRKAANSNSMFYFVVAIALLIGFIIAAPQR